MSSKKVRTLPKEELTTSANTTKVSNSLIPLILSGFVVFIAFISRIKLLPLALSRDEGTYGYLGKMAMQGKIPYLDFYEMKPPLLYYFFGLGGSVFGYSESGYRIYFLLISLLSCFFIFKIGVNIFNSFAAAGIAACSYALLSINIFAFGYAIVAEHLVNLFFLISIYLISLADHKKYNLILGGVFFAFAIFTKQTSILLAPILFIFLYQKSNPFKSGLIDFLFVSTGVISISVSVFLFLFATSSLQEAIFWMWTYPNLYSDALPWDVGKKFLKYFFSGITQFQPFIFTLAFISLIVSTVCLRKYYGFTWIVYLMLSTCTIFLGYRFYGQYWLLIFPAISLILANGVYLLVDKTKFNFLYILISVVFLFDVLSHQTWYFNGKNNAIYSELLKNNPFPEIKKLSEYANKIMQKTDRLMVMGSEPQVYLYCNKNAPTKHIFMSMLSRKNAKAESFIEEVTQDVEKQRPEYIFFNIVPFSWMAQSNNNGNLIYSRMFNFTINNYTPIACYNMDEKKYYFKEESSKIDTYKPNQIILFKRK